MSEMGQQRPTRQIATGGEVDRKPPFPAARANRHDLAESGRYLSLLSGKPLLQANQLGAVPFSVRRGKQCPLNNV
jgi:hypothetical protein